MGVGTMRWLMGDRRWNSLWRKDEEEEKESAAAKDTVAGDEKIAPAQEEALIPSDVSVRPEGLH